MSIESRVGTPTKKSFPDISSLIRNYSFEVQEQDTPPGAFMQKWLNYQVNVLGGKREENKVNKLTDLDQQLTAASEGQCECVRPNESILSLAKIFVQGMMEGVKRN